jgi:hypothetical protein
MPTGFLSNRRNIILITLLFSVLALILIISVFNPKKSTQNNNSSSQSVSELKVVSINPNPLDNINMATRFELTFNRPISFEKLYVLTSPFRPLLVSQGENNTKINIAPKGVWIADQEIKITILTTSQAEDKSTLAKDYSFSFKPTPGEIEIIREGSASGRLE